MGREFRFDPKTYLGLDKLGRVPLSRSFHMREFLYSEIAAHYALRNVPDNVDRAVQSGRELCGLLLEPLQAAFGRINIRSGYRSRAVNSAGVDKHNCAADNDGAHTWDHKSTSGQGYGAMACISIPSISKKILAGEASPESIAWWIHDHLRDWSTLEFFATPDLVFADEVAFNIGWHEKPIKKMTSWRGGPRDLLATIPDADSRRKIWMPLSD